MDWTALTQAVGSVGFPIVACVAMFWQNSKNEERHAEAMEKLQEALNNNTVAITELSERMNKQ